MWSTNGWFGFTREKIQSLGEGTLHEAQDERSARTAAMKFSSKPENKDNTYHISKMGEKHYVSLYPSSSDIATYKAGKIINEAIHRVDWDGPSDVTVVKRTPDEIEVRRVDSSGQPLSGDDHSTTYTKYEPEYHQIASKEQDVDDSEAWREKRSARLQGRMYHESAQYITESVTTHGIYELTPGKKLDSAERVPSHVVAHTHKMNKLGVPVHDKTGYGDAISIKVKNTKTGDVTLHHVYQRDKSSRDDESSKRLVTVRPVGRMTSESEAHNQVIKNYLAGKRAPKE